jgi:lysophospholipase L1-like esterase
VHVVNLGAPGMNTSQLVRRLEGYIHLHRPDLILPLIGNNDVWNAAENYITVIGHREEDELDEQLAADLKLWADKLRVVRLMRSALLLVHDGRKDYFNPMESRGPDWGAFHHGMEYLGTVEHVTDLYLMNYRRMEKIAAKYGAEILWLDYHVGARLGETAYVEVALKEMGVPSVDLFPLFHDGPQPKGLLRKEEPTARRDLLNNDLWHPNATGYALIARAVYNKMVELDYVGGPQIAIFEDLEPYTDSAPSGHAKAIPSGEATPSPPEESAGL